MRTRIWVSLIVLFAVTSFVTCVRADDDDDGPANDDRSGVARVSLIHGDVSMQRGDSGDWAAATINTPLLRGDQVATGERSRMEVQLDYANILRLSSSSQAKIADLTRTRIQIQLAQGYANYTVFKGSEADVEIDTPNVAVRPLKPGRYRVQVNSDYETDVIVRDGEAEISTPQGSTTVREGRMAMIRGEDNPEYRVDDAPRRDDWDRWNKDRDNTIRDAQGYRQTSPYYTGAQDLDGYGRWVYVPGYGRVWQPYEQSASWAPYQSGRWVWEPYWGWTWVSYEPWGWAPYHYGRWFYWRSAWVWWPGPVQSYYRPVWSPAFVTFIGFGHHSGFAFGFGSIGWIPCGPSDYYYPWYGRGYNNVNVVNITNITNVRNVHYVVRPLAVPGRQHYYSNVDMTLRNPRMRGAISGVNAEEFGRGNVRVRRLDVGDRDLRDSRVMTGNLPVVPTRDSLHAGGGAPVRMNIRPRQEERFYTRHQPPAGPPAFHDQVSRMQQVVGEHTQPAQVPKIQSGGSGGVRPSGIYRIPPSGQQGDANRGGFHTQPAQVPMTRGSDGQGTRPSGIYRIPPNGQQGNAETPNHGGDRGGWRSFGGGNRPDTGNQGNMRGPGNGGMPGRGNGNGGTSVTASPEPQQRDRGGWQRFPSRNDSGSNGRSQDATPGPRGGDRGNPRVDRSGAPDRNASGSGSGDNGGFRRFPSPSERAPQQPDRTQQPSSVPENRSGNGGGWQRFPSNSDRGSRDNSSMNRGDRTDAGSRPYSKPRLDLEKPIVRPRGSDVRMEPRRESPPPRQRMPEMRSEPSRNTPSPSPSRGPSMRGGGGSAPRSSPSPSRGGGNNRGGDKGSRGRDN